MSDKPICPEDPNWINLPSELLLLLRVAAQARLHAAQNRKEGYLALAEKGEAYALALEQHVKERL